MSKGITSFQDFTDSESTHYLADHWPKGKLTGRRHDSNSVLYKYIKSMAFWIKIFTGQLLALVRNIDIDQSESLLPEWEKSVGIPDQIPRLEAIYGRRNAVKCLVSKRPVYNIDDGIVDESTTFEQYIECLTGLDVSIRTAGVDGTGSVFPMAFPVQFGLGGASGNFLFVIGVPVAGAAPNNQFPLPFPVQFFTPMVPEATMELLDKVLDRVIPSFCRWEYEAIF